MGTGVRAEIGTGVSIHHHPKPTKHLLRARHCPTSWRYSSEQTMNYPALMAGTLE